MSFIAEVVLAHGAGQGKDSEFMVTLSDLFMQHQIMCRTFNFDYMETMVETGKRRPPDRLPRLLDCFKAQLVSTSGLPLFIAGKSMGGRVATHVLQESAAEGAMCFGYPFHPPGKPDKLRTEHFPDIAKPVLILQGERDPFGKRQEIPDYKLPGNIQVDYIPDGEHSFKPLKSSAHNWHDNMVLAVEKSCDFIKSLM